MANTLYPKYKETILAPGGSGVDLSADTIKVALVDTGTYTYSSAHQFYSSVSGVVGTPVTLASKTVTSGAFDAADITFTGVAGATVETLIFYKDTGVAGTSNLIYYMDVVTSGLPVTPNGGDVSVTFNASGIFAL